METKKIPHPDLNRMTSIIIGKLMNVGGMLQKESNRLLLPHDLNQQQFSILFEIGLVKKVQQKDLVNRLMLERAHVSKVVSKLEEQGLISIHPCQDDKRSTIISTTKKGDLVIKECRAIFTQWRKECFSSFDSDELTQMLESIDLIQNAFKKQLNGRP
jgi:DNA-binding MarR family transcriptional regulator